MNRKLSALWRFFVSNDKQFFVQLEKSGENVLEAAKMLENLFSVPQSKRKAVAKDIVAIEHTNDLATKEIATALNKTFVTPIDREDIYTLATQLDDILDLIDDIADYVHIYHLGSIRPSAKKQAALITDSMNEIVEALTHLNDFKSIQKQYAAVSENENRGDRLERDAIAKLFEEEKNSTELLAWKDMYERLEDAVNTTKHVVTTLNGIIIKNS